VFDGCYECDVVGVDVLWFRHGSAIKTESQRIYIVEHTLTLKFLNLDVMPTHIMQSQCNTRNQFIKIIQGMDTG
jgi:hypothetical protein